jgi:DNA-binding Lrp family transcriptional regulator
LKAYILVNTELGETSEVVRELKEIMEIKNVYIVYGIYDIIVEVEVDAMDKVKELVFDKVRRLNYVKSTITLIADNETMRAARNI